MASASQSIFRALRQRLASRGALFSQEADALSNLTAVLRHLPAGTPWDSGPRPFEVLLSGLACRYIISRTGRRQIIAYLVPGDFCDSHAGDPEFSDHLIGTLSAVTTASLSDDSITDFTVRFPRLLRALNGFEVAEEATARQWLLNLGQRDALERTSHLLCELFMRLDCVGLTSTTGCGLALTQADLADALAMSSVHMNRTLMKLRRLKLASLLRYRLTLYDFEELKTLAGFAPGYLGMSDQPRPGRAAVIDPSASPLTCGSSG